MIGWLRRYMKYSRHEDWLEHHFGGYMAARDGSAILTTIVDRLGNIDPNGADFSARAMSEIRALTRPCDIYGQVVAYHVDHKPMESEVPARLVTPEVVRTHALYILDLRRSTANYGRGRV